MKLTDEQKLSGLQWLLDCYKSEICSFTPNEKFIPSTPYMCHAYRNFEGMEISLYSDIPELKRFKPYGTGNGAWTCEMTYKLLAIRLCMEYIIARGVEREKMKKRKKRKKFETVKNFVENFSKLDK